MLVTITKNVPYNEVQGLCHEIIDLFLVKPFPGEFL